MVSGLRSAGLVSQRGGFLFARHPLLFFYADGGGPMFVQARSLDPGAAPKELRPAGAACHLIRTATVL